MKKTGWTSILVFSVLIVSTSICEAQFRDAQNRADYSGPIIKKQSSQAGNLGNLFNMQMNHSYSMMFSSMGGQFQNLNAYTNTMQFFFSERLTGRLDVSLLHSPFGNSYMNTNSDNSFGADIIIRNAELNYQLGDNSNIRVQFQQLPSYGYRYGMGPWSHYYNSPFGERNFR